MPQKVRLKIPKWNAFIRPEQNDSVISKEIIPFEHFKMAFSTPTTKICQMYLEDNINS